MCNAAYSSRMSEHCGNLALEMERRSTQFFGICKTALHAVPNAVFAAMEAVPTAISHRQLIDAIDADAQATHDT